jgi:hypothetical protein
VRQAVAAQGGELEFPPAEENTEIDTNPGVVEFFEINVRMPLLGG